MAREAAGHGDWRFHAWLLPATLGSAATVLLSWSAWITARAPAWPDRYHTWWWTALRPADDGALLVTVALWVTALVSYWWPRRFQHQPIGLISVVAMIFIGGVLSSASLLPCRNGMTYTGVLGWLLALYLGQPPGAFPGGGCPGRPPLAMQLGQIISPGATMIGALAVGSALWREPVARMQSRFARDATVFTGLDKLTLPLLRELTATARSPRAIIVIEPDEDHPLLDEARLTGARVIIGDPASTRLLRPIISGLSGCALSRLYALDGAVDQNEKVVAAAARVLRRYQPDPDRQPLLIALVDDPRHADAWRGGHSGTSDVWFEDALSSVESTATGLATRILQTGAREVLLCGDSGLALAILCEFARRGWEQAELDAAAAAGHAIGPLPPGLPVNRIQLLDPRSEDMCREYIANVPAAIRGSAPSVVARSALWQDRLLSTLDAMDKTAVRQTAVIIVDDRYQISQHEAGRVARLHIDTPVFVLAPPGAGRVRPIFGRLHPFERSLLVDGAVPDNAWTRIARHWHECYRLSNPVPPGDPRTATRLPWAELDEFTREDNILQLRSILAQVTALGRRWTPVRLAVSGSMIELSERELSKVAEGEHARWYRRRLAAGWSGGGGRERPGSKPRHGSAPNINKLMVPWTDLPADERTRRTEHVRTQLAQLEDVGFLPVVPAGGPPEASRFDRVGVVRAMRLAAPLRWRLRSGDEMLGDAGDWRVTDEAGRVRTVRDAEFRASHEPLGDGRWRRIGGFVAWQVRETLVIRTWEGTATASPGDWIVEGPHGERWPVCDRQFRRSYRPSPERPEPDHAEPERASSAPVPCGTGADVTQQRRRPAGQALPASRQPSA